MALFWLIEADFRAFILLVETIIEIRRNIQYLKNISAREILFLEEEMDFPASGNHFFPFLRDSCQFLFRLVEKYFSTKSFIPVSGNRFFGLWNPFSFVQSFSLDVETVTEISRSQFLKKDHILTNKNRFSGLWKPFSSIFLDSSQLLPVEAVFLSAETWKQVFVCWKRGNKLLPAGNLLFWVFFYLWKL